METQIPYGKLANENSKSSAIPKVADARDVVIEGLDHNNAIPIRNPPIRIKQRRRLANNSTCCLTAKLIVGTIFFVTGIVMLPIGMYLMMNGRNNQNNNDVSPDEVIRQQSVLTNAIYKNDVKTVKALLESYWFLDVNWRHLDDANYNCFNWPTLHAATAMHVATACNSSVDSVEALIDADANVNSRNQYSPLIYAAGNNNADVVRLLLDSGADLEETVQYVKGTKNEKIGYTALLIAIEKGNCDIVRLLLKRGANLYATSGNGENALNLAIKSKNDKLVQFIKWMINGEKPVADNEKLLHVNIHKTAKSAIRTVLENANVTKKPPK